MLKIFLSICLAFLLGCSGAPPKEQQLLHGILTQQQCPSGNFRGHGIAEDEMVATNMARAMIASEIQSSISVQSEHKSELINEVDSEHWKKQISSVSYLNNASDAKIIFKKQQGKEFGVVVCMSRADASKGFVERQRLVADSLSLVSQVLPSITHPKQKNEAWSRTQTLWNEFTRLQVMLDGFGVARTDLFNSVGEIHSKTKEDYKNYCQNAKLHWNVKQGNEYSEIAFSVLSKKLRIEKSTCQGDGISLTYKGSEPICAYKFGLYTCSDKPSLSVASCDSIEYLLLENSVDGAHQREDFALERVQTRLKTADFWDKWIQEIQLWRPLCE
ncbi:MAG: hypothetical protein FWC15_03260 [Fibromonadales bacterium]|nr:hypothetical protein [Fibromonadales bacterium]